ncbi:MAG: HAMP domain-containing sensor histidine kinase [Deltaproteobacteria bacterium]|nr:HAMP domain-containing sensor histidine kinase [Deltaproteobacteria bacterium]
MPPDAPPDNPSAFLQRIAALESELAQSRDRAAAQARETAALREQMEREHLRKLLTTQQLRHALRASVPPVLSDGIHAQGFYIGSEQSSAATMGYHWIEPAKTFAIYLIDVALPGTRSCVVALTLRNAIALTQWSPAIGRDPSAVLARWDEETALSKVEDGSLWYGVVDLTARTLRWISHGAIDAKLSTEHTVGWLEGSRAESQRALTAKTTLWIGNPAASSLLASKLERFNSMEAENQPDFESVSQVFSAFRPSSESVVQTCALVSLRLVAQVNTGGLVSVPHLGEHEEAQWLQSVSALTHPTQEDMKSLAVRHTRLARRLEKVSRISDLYQRELRSSKAAFEEANSDLLEFAGRVAHDLKNPLAGVMGFASMLCEESFSNDPSLVRSTSNDIVWSAQKMLEIIDALLLLAQARRGAVQFDSVDLGAVFAQVQQRVVPIQTQLEGTLEVPAQWPRALGYAPWIEAALVNLVTNAFRYGGRPPHVKLSCEIADQTLEIVISDNGRGLTEDQIARLFQPFVRLTSTEGGHGLGLTIVRRVCERMNGSVRVQSVVGAGASFVVTLPFHRR